jgi:glycerophosphoryl diester phosphodiesterase
MARPVVISHRGASGYRPENTLEAFQLGISQGADGLEFDLVNTKDQKLIIRHENALSKTTNISSKPEFQHLRRVGEVAGEELSDWFSEDLTLQEVKSLRAIERLPEVRPGSALFDNQFSVPTFSDLLNSEFITGKVLVVELKEGTHLKVLDQTIGALAAQDILNSNIQDLDVKLIIESFSYEILLNAKSQIQNLGLKASYFLALEKTSLEILDLEELASEVVGIAISLDMLFSSDDWVKSAHDAGLLIWVYTARAEKARTSVEAYYEEIIQTGVDGIFADQPDLLIRVLADRG